MVAEQASATRFTPGPWDRSATEILKYGENWASIAIIADPGAAGDSAGNARRLTTGVPRFAEAVANANLITAAPDLYAVVHEYLQNREWMILAGGASGSLPQDVIHKFAEMQLLLVDRARAALAKAEGRS